MSVEISRAEAASQQHLSSARSKKASPKQAPLREIAIPLSAVEQTDNETSNVAKSSARLIDADGPVSLTFIKGDLLPVGVPFAFSPLKRGYIFATPQPVGTALPFLQLSVPSSESRK